MSSCCSRWSRPLASTATASTPGTNGAILFTQSRCPGWVGFRCTAPPQPCASIPSPALVRPVAAARSCPVAGRTPLSPSTAFRGRRLQAPRRERRRRARARRSRRPTAPPPGPAWSPDGSKPRVPSAPPTNPSPFDVVDLGQAPSPSRSPALPASRGRRTASETRGRRLRPERAAGDRCGRPPGPARPLRHERARRPDQPADSEPDWSPDSVQLAFTHREPSVCRRGSRLSRATARAAASSSAGRARHRGRPTAAGSPSSGRRRVDGRTRRARPRVELSAVPGILAARPRWLDAGQTAVLRSIGNCDADVGELRYRRVRERTPSTRAASGVDTFVVTAVRIGGLRPGGTTSSSSVMRIQARLDVPRRRGRATTTSRSTAPRTT